jgi:hypothetical protein
VQLVQRPKYTQQVQYQYQERKHANEFNQTAVVTQKKKNTKGGYLPHNAL